jgi:protein-disulfide isomerase
VVKGTARKKQAPKRTFYLGLGALALAGVATLAWVANRPSAQAGARTVDPASITADAQPYVMGDTSAPVTIMEFADFQCVWCAQYAVVVEPDVKARIIDAGLAKYEFYPFPLEGHRNAWPAANAAACAGEQDRFWPMHEQLFRGQTSWANDGNPKGDFEGYAQAIGLNMDAWETCYDERRHQARIQATQAEGLRRGVRSTPTFIIGNRMLAGMQSADVIRAYVDSARTAAGVAAPATGNGGGAR